MIKRTQIIRQVTFNVLNILGLAFMLIGVLTGKRIRVTPHKLHGMIMVIIMLKEMIMNQIILLF